MGVGGWMTGSSPSTIPIHVEYVNYKLTGQVSSAVGVRHEVVQVAVVVVVSSGLTAIRRDTTRLSATGTLSRHASSGKPPLLGRRWGVKPWRQKYPASSWTATEPRGDVVTASIRRLGARVAWYG
jgi:hypothetical protein